MGIRIIPQDQLSTESKTTSIVGQIPPLLFANLQSLYTHRAARLRQLAEESPLKDYLNFTALIADAQQKALHDNPLSVDLSQAMTNALALGKTPLDTSLYPRSTHWHSLLQAIIAELRPDAPAHIQPILDNLDKAADSELEAMASRLLASEFTAVGNDKAPFIWAALSLYWTQLANQLPGKSKAVEYGEHRQYCPVCGSIPVASLVHIGGAEGLRYLHCNLCESEWHLVRIKCSNCEQTRDLNYWSLDSENAAVKAESCGDCGSYLKILYQEKDHRVEAVADDLATLVLDAKMEEEGFYRSGINPFLFPGE